MNGESFKVTFEAPRQKLLTLLCFSRTNKTVPFLIFISAFADFKYIAKDLISIHEV